MSIGFRLFFIIMTSLYAFPVFALDLRYFSPSQDDDFLVLKNGFSLRETKTQRYGLSIYYSYIKNPLNQTNPNGGLIGQPIKNFQTLQLQPYYYLNKNLFLMGQLSYIVNYQGEESSVFQPQPLSGNVLGDSEINLGYRIFQNKLSNLTFVGSLVLPTGDKEALFSNGSLGAGLELSYLMSLSKKVNLLANIGYKNLFDYESPEDVKGLDRAHQYLLGLGASYKITQKFTSTLEWNFISTNNSFSDSKPHSELSTALNYDIFENLKTLVGFGLKDFENFDYRVTAGLRFSFGKNKQPSVSSVASKTEKTPEEIIDGINKQKDEEKAEIVSSFDEKKRTEDQISPNSLLSDLQNSEYESLNLEVDSMRVLFAFDSATVNIEGEALLLDLIKALSENSASHGSLVIEGMASKDGPSKYNQGLSLRRAKSVKNKLIELGYTNKIIVKASGEDKHNARPFEPAKKYRSVIFNFIVN